MAFTLSWLSLCHGFHLILTSAFLLRPLAPPLRPHPSAQYHFADRIFRIKDARAKKREKKLWRESSYAELERETRDRLAGEELREAQRQGQAAKGREGKRVVSNDDATRDDGRRESWDSERGLRGEKG